MRSIPINVQTLYADLSQKVRQSAIVPASISRKVVGGATYLYAVERHGAARVQRYLGPEHDEAARVAAEAARREAELARGRRKTITMLKAAGVEGPRPEVGRLLEAISRAGLFRRGLVLVGTVAYQVYPMMLGVELDEAAMATEDADFVAANVRLATDEGVLVSDDEEPFNEGTNTGGLLAVLRRADPTFTPAPTLRKSALPSRFTSRTGLDVELLTPVRRRDEEEPVPLPHLSAGAIPLQFLEYLVESALPAVVLHGSGVAVTVPQPARYAVHKLIVAQRRMTDSPKRGKDLAQARALFDVLEATSPDALDDALDDARERGPNWGRLIDASLRQIGRG